MFHELLTAPADRFDTYFLPARLRRVRRRSRSRRRQQGQYNFGASRVIIAACRYLLPFSRASGRRPGSLCRRDRQSRQRGRGAAPFCAPADRPPAALAAARPGRASARGRATLGRRARSGM